MCRETCVRSASCRHFLAPWTVDLFRIKGAFIFYNILKRRWGCSIFSRWADCLSFVSDRDINILTGVPCVHYEWVDDCVNNNRPYEECRIDRIQRTLYLHRGNANSSKCSARYVTGGIEIVWFINVLDLSEMKGMWSCPFSLCTQNWKWNSSSEDVVTSWVSLSFVFYLVLNPSLLLWLCVTDHVFQVSICGPIR